MWDLKFTNIQKVCRICLGECDTTANLFEKNEPYGISVADLLYQCMLLKVTEREELPRLICRSCKKLTVEIYEFKQKFEKSSRCLQEYLANVASKGADDEQIIVIMKDDDECILGDAKEHYYVGLDDAVTEIGDKEEQNINETASSSKTDSKSTYKCCKCEKRFDSKINLIIHRKVLGHYTRKTRLCPHCKCKVPSQNYKSHVFKHSLVFNCRFCSKTFSNNFNLKRHVNIHTSQKPYVCHLCGANFGRQDKLKRHIQVHTHEKPFVCETCGLQFHFKDKLKEHQESSSECRLTRHSGRYKRSLSCDVCNKTFARYSSLSIHKLLHTEERVICADCGNPYPNEKKLKEHQSIVHSTDKSGISKKKFLCSICANQYTTKGTLDRHMLSHMGLARTFQCNICNKSFTQSGSLTLHLKIHTGERPYVCHICSRAFNKPSNLQRHLQNHNNVRPYVCAICEKSFTVKHTLMVHTRIHTGEKPFSCTVCCKSFVDKGSLGKHMKIHNQNS